LAIWHFQSQSNNLPHSRPVSFQTAFNHLSRDPRLSDQKIYWLC